MQKIEVAEQDKEIIKKSLNDINVNVHSEMTENGICTLEIDDIDKDTLLSVSRRHFAYKEKLEEKL